MPLFAIIFLSTWLLGALYQLSRRLRFGKYGVFLGGRLLFEGPPIRFATRWRHRLSMTVLASSNRRRPIGLKFDVRGPTSVSRNIWSLSNKAAHELRRLVGEAHAAAIDDPTLRDHRVGSVRVLWMTFSVYAGTKTSLVGLGLLGFVRAIPDDQYGLFIHSYDSALKTAEAT